MKRTNLLLLISLLTASINAQIWTKGTSRLYVNPTSTKVGIGTTCPSSKLQINATTSGQHGLRVQIQGSTKFMVNSNGGTTIGTYNTSSPSNGLYVYNRININTTSSDATSRLNITNGWGDWMQFHNTDNTGYWAFHNGEDQEIFHIRYNKPDGTSVYPMRFTSDSKVGINTSSPRDFLDVCGGGITTDGDLCIAGDINNINNNWGIRCNGENLEFVEPEDNNKLWARFIDDNGLELTGAPNLYVKGYINVSASGSSWLTGKTGTGGITSTTQLTSNAYHPLIRQETASGHFVNLGGLGDYWGFFGYDKDRTANGYDYTMIMDLNTGNVGIGTSVGSLGTSSHKLSVEGSICAREIVVLSSGWSDFVFEDDYNLRSLTEVEELINKEGHLPEIPSAKEVEGNGISVGEMNAKLLQKIEELTLYIIEQEKRISELEKNMCK